MTSRFMESSAMHARLSPKRMPRQIPHPATLLCWPRLTQARLACIIQWPQAGQAVAISPSGNRGKSALHRARRRGNPGTERSVGSGHRKRQPGLVAAWGTAATRFLRGRRAGHGEKAVQETTGAHSNVNGQATPVGSKVKQRRWSGPLQLSLG
jgi:hypothetical protein